MNCLRKYSRKKDISAEEKAGSSGKEENTMPVEVAIQRELEYRRITASFHLRPNTNSTQEFKSSSAAVHLKPLPGSSSKNFSSLSGTKRKEPSTRSSHQQPFHESFNGEAKTDDIHCEICQIACSSPSNLKQHLKGHKHRQMLQKGRSNQTQRCEVCSVLCMNEDLLKLHFQGQKHKTKLQMLKISKECGEAPNKPRWCELCKIWCSDEFSFKQHLEGKKHIFQLHVIEKVKER